LRDALCDNAEQPRFVETLPRKGYRFIASVDAGNGPAITIPVEAEAASSHAETDVAAGSGRPREGNALPYRRIVATIATVAIVVAAILAGFNIAGLRDRLLTVAGARSRRSWMPPPRIESIAVLPLENLTGDPAQEYFVDGMTDALITDLAQISSLRVISRTSAMRYRGTRLSLPQIGRELNVDAVVEGTVTRQGSRARISAQLIEVATDRHLWAKAYERDVRDIVALQGDVAQAIAGEIQIRVTPQELSRLARKRPVVPEAYEAYLRGRFLWNKRNKEALAKSIEYFEEAIRIDPNYAPAYAGLADTYTVLGSGIPSGIDPKEAGGKAISAGQKAVELDATLAEGHAALAFALFRFRQSPSIPSEQIANGFRRAIELNPGYATAHHWYALFKRRNGKLQEGLREIQLAQQLDPASPSINGVLGEFYSDLNQFDRALEQYRKTIELDPQQYNSRVRLAVLYQRLHRYDESLAELSKAESISPGSLSTKAWLGYVHAVSGNKREARRILAELRNEAVKAGHPGAVSLVYLGLRDRENALLWGEKALEAGDPWMRWDAPEADWLRSDPRFQAQLRRWEDIER